MSHSLLLQRYRAALALALLLGCSTGWAQVAPLIARPDFQNLIYEAAPVPPPGTSLSQAGSITFLSGNVALPGGLATPRGGTIELLQSTIAQPFAGAPFQRSEFPPDCLTNTLVVQGHGTVTQSPPPQGGCYTKGQSVTLTAVPGDCFRAFSQWSGGVTDNPRTVTMVSNGTYTAIFTNTGPFLPPAIACPSNVVVECAGTNGTVVMFSASAVDACGTNLPVVCAPASGALFPQGTTTVACVTVDARGLSNSCSFTVTVGDTQAPAIICPDNITADTDAFQCGKSNVTYTATATDNCPGVGVACAPVSGSTFAKGVTTVTCTAADVSGNTNSCSFTVTINDTETPASTCPANITGVADAGACGKTNVAWTVSSSDNCAVTNTVCNPASGSTFTVGVTTVNCGVADASGNTNGCTFIVTITDTEAPTITCPANITGVADAGACEKTNVTWTLMSGDNCSVTNSACDPASGSTFAVGVTTVSCGVADASGNTNGCTFTVRVLGATGVVINCPTNLIAECTGPAGASVVFNVTATASCDTNVTTTCFPPSSSVFPIGPTAVTCMAFDGSGHTNDCSFTVTVVDTTRPVITVCPTNRAVVLGGGECVATVPDLTAELSATDACGPVTVTQSPAAGTPANIGTNVVTLTARDAFGNETSCAVTVEISPLLVPVKVIINTNGMVTRSPDQALYTNCQMVTLTAVPTNCYWAFSHWTDGVTTNTANPLVITVGPTNCYTAIFTNLVLGCSNDLIIVTVNGQTGEGFYLTNRAEVCITSSIPNAVLRFTEDCTEPNAGSTRYNGCFTVLYGGIFPELDTVVVRVAAFSPGGQLLAQQACPITMVFTNECEGYFRLAATAKGSLNGEVAGGGVDIRPLRTPYPCGTPVQLNARASQGWTFMGWLRDLEGANTNEVVIMDRDKCVEAVFGTRLTANAGPNGTVSMSPVAALHPYGSEVKLAARPNAGFYFANWSDGRTNNPRTFQIITDNPSLTANFAPLTGGQFALTVISDGRGTVQVRPARAQYAPGTMVTNVARPDAGQSFLGWSGATNGATMIGATQIVAMTSSRVITAHFTQRSQLDIVRCLGELNSEGFELMVTGEMGARYVIQAVTHFEGGSMMTNTNDWMTLGTVTNVLGMVGFIDRSNTNHTQRFYRACQVP